MFEWLLDGGPTALFATTEAMPVDISRKNGDLIVRASVPGFEAKEIDLQVDGNTADAPDRCHTVVLNVERELLLHSKTPPGEGWGSGLRGLVSLAATRALRNP